MPTLGYNLQTLKDHFLKLLELRFSLEGSVRWSDAEIFRALNEAQRVFQERLWLNTIFVSLPLEAGVDAYDLPAAMLGHQLGQVMTSGGLEVRRFPFNPGDPPEIGFSVRPYDRRLVVYPTPSQAAAITLEYSAIPSPLYRLWMPSDVTVSLTAGSAVVQVSGALSALLAAGDEFGLVFDYSGEDQSPSFWFAVESVDRDANTITLSEDPGLTLSAQAFLTAQVSDFERLWPGKLGYALADYAAGWTIRTQDPEKAAGLMSLALSVLDSFSPDGGTFDIGQSQAAAAVPSFFQEV
jgi:hypothetical protein